MLFGLSLNDLVLSLKDLNESHLSFYNVFGYVWIRWILNFGCVWICDSTFWIRALFLDTRQFLDMFGYAMEKRSSIQKYPTHVQNIILDTFGYANGKTKEKQNGYPKVSKHFGYVLQASLCTALRSLFVAF